MIAHRYSTRIIAVVDFIYSVLWVIFGSYWTLIMTVAAGCGLIGAQIFNGCLVVTYAAVSWAWVFATILNIIIVTARHGVDADARHRPKRCPRRSSSSAGMDASTIAEDIATGTSGSTSSS